METSWVTPGSPVSTIRNGTPAASRSSSSSSRHPVAPRARKASRWPTGSERRPAGLALPRRPGHAAAVVAVGRDQRGDGLGVDPGQPGRPHERGVGLGDQPDRRLDAVDDLPDRPALGIDGVDERRLGVRERRGDRPLGIERADDDGRRAAGPGDVGEPADAGRAVGVGKGRRGAGGEDDGGDGHRAPSLVCRRSVATVRRTFPADAGYCRVTPAAPPPGEGPLPTSLGLWSAVLRRSRADLPVVLASWALLASALSLLAAGTLYSDAVTLAGLHRELRNAPPAERAIVVRTKILPERIAAADEAVISRSSGGPSPRRAARSRRCSSPRPTRTPRPTRRR